MGAKMRLSVKTRPCGRSLASGLRGAQDLKLLLRVKEPALSTVFWLEKTVAGGITTTRQFCPRNLSGEEKLVDLCVSVPAVGLIGLKAVLSPSFLRFLMRAAAVDISLLGLRHA